MDADRGYNLASFQARLDYEGVLTESINALGARTGNAEAGINSLSTA